MNLIRNIWAVGRNYAEHAKELGNAVPSKPLIFLKAGSTAVFGNEIPIPAWCQDVHHEIELALQLDQQLKISKYGLALDLTERSIQNELKTKGQPWTLAKSFSHSCPLSEFKSIPDIKHLASAQISLKINSVVKQSGNISEMIFDLQTLVDYVKNHFPVCPDDVILTGTPAGVGAIKKGDRLEADLRMNSDLNSEILLKHEWLVS